MPFPVPSRDDLTAQITADQQVRIAGADTSLRYSVLGILAKVWAGPLALIWGFLGRYWSKQFFVDSAESPYLERRLAPYGIVPENAAPATGNVIFTGTSGVSIPIPIGTIVQTQDGSIQYATLAAATMTTGTVTVAVAATVGSSASNQPAGTILALYAAIAGVNPAAIVDPSGLSGGADAETDTSLRTRGIARLAQPPQGGAWFDYVAWAKTVPGVTRVWVYPLNRGAGTVDVTFVMDGRTNIVPLSGDVANVQAALNNLRPVTANVLVWAPTTAALTITIANLNPNNAQTQANITAQLNQLADSVAPGGAQYGDGVSTAAPGGVLDLSQIYAAIEAAGGIVDFDLTAPTVDTTYGTGVIPAAPTITIT
jgi:uncharacterized phage protein gp47/JayE